MSDDLKETSNPEGQEKETKEESNDESGDSSSDEDEAQKMETEEPPSLESNPRLLLAAAQVAVDANVYDYAAHVNLINVARELKDFGVLRGARENMSKIWPLTEALWLDWVKDEIELGELPASEVFHLFDRGTEDYLSPNLWLEYCKYSLILIKEAQEDSVKKVTDVFERAITAVGVHLSFGGLIFDSYRDFLEVVGGESEEDALALRKLYQRQLSIPLIGIHETYSDFIETFGSEDEELKKLRAKNSALLAKLKPYEEKLQKDQSVEVYREYLEAEIALGDPGRIRCLFERAIQDHCLLPDLWAKYIEYVGNKLKDYKLCYRICKRCVRNVPWATSAWQLYVNCAEHLGRPHSEVKAIFNEALICLYGENTSDLYLVYLSYLRRKMSEGDYQDKELMKSFRDCYHKGFENLAEFGEALYPLKRFVALVEAKVLKNLDKFRKIFDNILLENSLKTERWIDYLRLEEQFGTPMHVHKLFLRALMYPRMDEPQKLVDHFLMSERCAGTLDSFEVAFFKCEAFLKQVATIAAKEAVNQDSSNRKRAAEDFKVPAAPPTKKSRTHPAESNGNTETSGSKSFVDNGDDSDAVSKEKKKPKKNLLSISDDENAEVSVFLSNLDFSVTEDDIREFLQECGEISGVSLAKNMAGKSKGFGNCIFKNKSSVDKALKLDRGTLNDRPVYISRFNAKKKQAESASTFQFPYETKLEKQKLFVSGLNPETSKETLEKEFGAFGEVKDVRIVTYRNGKSKGIAFIEFADEASAKKAIIGLDNKQLEGNSISVAISNPPSRKGRYTGPPPAPPANSEAEYRGKGRSQIQLLVPRAAASKKPAQPSSKPSTKSANPFKSSVAPKASESGSSARQEDENDDKLASEAAAKPLSNKDFLKFLKS